MVDALLLRVGELLATSLVNTLGCHFARVVLSRDKKRKIFLSGRKKSWKPRLFGCFKHRQSGLIGFSVGSSKVPSSWRGKHRSAYYGPLLSPALFSPRFLISIIEDVSHKSSLLSNCPPYPLHPRWMRVMRHGQTQRAPTQQAEILRLHRIGHHGPCQQSLERRL